MKNVFGCSQNGTCQDFGVCQYLPKYKKKTKAEETSWNKLETYYRLLFDHFMMLEIDIFAINQVQIGKNMW